MTHSLPTTNNNGTIRALVIVGDYPNKDTHALMYVHVRNKYYLKNNIIPVVLSFSATGDYEYDGIKVISYKTYLKSGMNFDILICHAPNIKNHYKFLRKFEARFKKILFVFHGHEILKVSEVYPPEYPWVKKSHNSLVRNIYDDMKFLLWRIKIKELLPKSHLVFVSDWLYKRFLYYVRLNPKDLDKKVSIINNSVGELFEKKNYNRQTPKKYDFITIRGSSLDGSKYGIDLVCRLAVNNAKNNFLIIGKGDFFKFNSIPKNIKYIDKALRHDEMLNYIDKSKCALLPTKQDTQGVITCEMVTYGIPTITSDIEICREIFCESDNVGFISNENVEKTNLASILDELEKNTTIKNKKFFRKNTTSLEVDLIKKMLEEES